MNESQRLKSQNQFLKKRQRLLKNNWKHGIIGVENPEKPLSDVYKEIRNDREAKFSVKVKRAKHRFNNLIRNDHSFENKTKSKSPKNVEYDHQWKTKKLNPEIFRSTFTDIFVPHIPSQNKDRMRKLISEESKGRHFKII
mmetsp:Transcript_23617/g.20984  ORF Transcript_23617/g.20984 Transcript_23617/m.20984 type:complete len:140 (-) Transcript_23617:44-463(-)